MTRGVSLATWDELGTLGRETAVYRALAPRVGGVAVISYGGSDEVAPEGLEVHANRHGLPLRAYAQAIPLIHRRALSDARVLKTNQVYGGTAALRSARLHHKPLIARCGFLWSEVTEADHGPRSARARFVAQREQALFRGADAVVVTAPRLAEEVRRRYGVGARVIPGYVDTARFAPTGGARRDGSLVFVGRLSHEKNLAALIEALAGLEGASLTLAGDGPLRAELERLAGRHGVAAEFLGRVPHEQLPAVLGGAQTFVMPSLYEGHPKAVVEAMACGLPVIGTDVPGIRDVVRDGETGVLCGTAAVDLRAAIQRVLGDAALREQLGAAARAAAGELSLERIVELELDAIQAAETAR